jgi:hypothetical protein
METSLTPLSLPPLSGGHIGRTADVHGETPEWRAPGMARAHLPARLKGALLERGANRQSESSPLCPGRP